MATHKEFAQLGPEGRMATLAKMREIVLYQALDWAGSALAGGSLKPNDLGVLNTLSALIAALNQRDS